MEEQSRDIVSPRKRTRIDPRAKILMITHRLDGRLWCRLRATYPREHMHSSLVQPSVPTSSACSTNGGLEMNKLHNQQESHDSQPGFPASLSCVQGVAVFPPRQGYLRGICVPKKLTQLSLGPLQTVGLEECPSVTVCIGS